MQSCKILILWEILLIVKKWQALTSYCQNMPKLDRANYVAKLENKWMDLDFVFSIFLFDLI